MDIRSINQFLLTAVLISLAIGYPVFQSVWGGKSMSLTDWVLILSLPLLLVQVRSKYLAGISSFLSTGPVLFAISLLVSILFQVVDVGHVSSIGAWSKPFLLFVVLFIIIKNEYAQSCQTLILACKIILFGTILAGILGLGMYMIFDLPNPFLLIRTYYLGWIPVQLSGLDGHANGAAQLIFFSAIILWYNGVFRKGHQWVWGLVVISLLLTASKSLLVYSGVLCLMLGQMNKKAKVMLQIIGSLVLLLYILASHFLPFNKSTAPIHADFYTGIAAGRVAHITWQYTPYSSIKAACYKLFISSPLSGVGPGLYEDRLLTLQNKNDYPPAAKRIAPHFTYGGVAAKFGLIGIAGLLYLMIWIYKNIRLLYAIPERTIFSILYGSLALEALTTDFEYHRVFWVMNAWFLATLWNAKSSFARSQIQ